MPSLKLFSLGTSTRSLEEFLGLLRAHGVRIAVDVRRFPKSRFPHFSQQELRRALQEAGFDYHWLGDLLGGYRKGGYEAYMRTPEFEEGIRRLKDLATQGPTAYFCCERLPWRCHRRFITRRLRQEGCEVVEIY